MDENVEFLKTEFETSHSYFIHIENKLSDLLKYYFTLFLAVVSACYYISISDLFKDMRLFSLLIVALVFDLLGLFILCMYAELRTRKIKILEQLAVIREFFSNNSGSKDISNFMIMIKGINKCPKYLRRPSEDWYTILYIIFLNSIGLAFFIALLMYVILLIINMLLLTDKMDLKFSLDNKWMLIPSITFLIFLILCFCLQFKWITIFNYKLDRVREVRYKVENEYDLFPKTEQSFPWPLQFLDKMATKIESKIN